MAATNIAQEITRLTTAKADLKTSIEGKGVTVPSTTLLDGYAALVDQIEQGGGAEEAPESDVNFYDYTGFRVASYTIAEAKVLTALPTPPQHNGLTFQEWNWSLADIQSYNRQYIDIGANYVTTDGKTHIKIKVTDLTVSVYFRSMGGTLSINWGDGTTPSTHTYGTSESGYGFTHTYSQSGEYVLVVSSDTTTGYILPIYSNPLSWSAHCIEINAGSRFSLAYNSALAYCRLDAISLATDSNLEMNYGIRGSVFPILVFPRNTSLVLSLVGPVYQFQGIISFPKSITTMSGAGLTGANTSGRIILPEAMNGTVANDILGNCLYAKVISIPSSLGWTSQNNNYFSNCMNLEKLDIVQGWKPNFHVTINQSTRWTAETLVDFFTKLGTTQTAITLTFGNTNLNKLTADQKAIATNKGYTLA